MPVQMRATGISMGKAALVAVIGSLFLLVKETGAQVGTTICGCQPAVYEITLDFSVACDERTAGGPGINETACVESRETGEVVTDFIPVLITDIQFLELNGNLDTLQQEPLTGAFRDGDIVRYTSILAVQSEFGPNTLPRAFQMVLRGFNAVDQPLQVTWVITYNNDCGIFPILFEGQTQGWSVFTDLGAPPSFVCPLAALPSSQPSNAPATSFPTSAPVTAVPTLPDQTALPTSFPSIAPTASRPLTTEEPVAPTCPPIPPSPPVGKGGGKMDGGKMDGGKMDGGKMDGGKMEGGKMEGGKMEGGKMEGGKMGLPKMKMIYAGKMGGKGKRTRFLGVLQDYFSTSAAQAVDYEDQDEEELSLYYPRGERGLSELASLGSTGLQGGKMSYGVAPTPTAGCPEAPVPPTPVPPTPMPVLPKGKGKGKGGGKMEGGKMEGGKMEGGKMEGGKMEGGKAGGKMDLPKMKMVYAGKMGGGKMGKRVL